MSKATTANRSSGDLKAFLVAVAGFGLFYAAFFAQSFTSGDLLAPSDSLDFGLAAYLSPLQIWTDSLYSGYGQMTTEEAREHRPHVVFVDADNKILATGFDPAEAIEGSGLVRGDLTAS